MKNLNSRKIIVQLFIHRGVTCCVRWKVKSEGFIYLFIYYFLEKKQCHSQTEDISIFSSNFTHWSFKNLD